MSASLHHQMDVVIRRDRQVHRRAFLRRLSATAAATGALAWTDAMTLHADDLRRRGKACIQVFLSGGPSQFETFDPKPDHADGGETKAIATSVPGIHLAENLPHLAGRMDDLCIIRSMTSREGNHARAKFLLHTGYVQNASVKHPSLGSIASSELGNLESDLPSFVRIGTGGNSIGTSLLGVNHNPLVVNNTSLPPANTTLNTDEERYLRRLSLLDRLEPDSGETVEDHRALYDKASRMILSSEMDAFDIAMEPESIRQTYGDSEMAGSFLMARRLVESGVPFVEVVSKGWDTHKENFSRTSELCGQIDQPLAALLGDLKSRGMLEETLVIIMGEFGRSPAITGRGGRNHFPRVFSIAMAGGGVRGGQVIGASNENGSQVADRPVTVQDMQRTFCRSLGIDADKENISPIGRPIRIVEGGEVIEEAFSG